MLIEFKATNYRSIKETQTLSMVSSKYYNDLVEENCFDSGVGSLAQLLRTAVIYGPNAAGKSNLIRAIHFMQSFVLQSHKHQEGQRINTMPFALSSDARTKPSEFEIFFIQDGVRYQYGFALNAERVTEEWLLAYPEGKQQRWFQRIYDDKKGKDNWYFGSKFTGRKQLWQESTRKNALFLSTAIQLNNEQLKPVFEWFQHKLAVILPRDPINLNFSIDQCASEEGKANIMKFMNSADLSISGINVELKKIPIPPEILPSGIPQKLKEKMVKDLHEKGVPLIRFQHRDDKNEPVFFDISDESDGTQRFFAFAGPWLDVMAKGRVLFIDELDTSLHPLLVRFLIETLHNSKTNPHNAQLIFTTHDTSLLDAELFRRDQIWFMEKEKSNATTMYPLSDFRARKKEALEKRYLQGRYGALPLIGDLRH